jgi:hypothetical protein
MDVCPCGALADTTVEHHTALTSHDCMWHNSVRCRVCITIRQIEDFLARVAGSKTGEAA